MRASTHRGVALVLVAILSATALAGCTSSVRDRQDDLGAGFVKRSCGEVTPRTADVGSTDRARALGLPVPLGLVQQPPIPPAELVVGTLFAADSAQADLRRAVDLAADEVNAGTTLTLTVLHGDAPTPAGLVALAAQGADAVVAAPVTAELLEQAVESKVVVFAPTTTDPAISLERRNEQYFYRTTPSASLEGATLADLLWKDGCKTVGILTVDDGVAPHVGARFREAFESKGGTVREFVVATGTPTAGQAAQAARNDPDAVLLVAGTVPAAEAVKHAFDGKKMKRTVWFFASPERSEAFVDAVGKRRNDETKRDEFVVAGLRGTSPETTTGPAHGAFVDAWADAYGGSTPGPGAAEAYDSTLLAALAAARTIGDNREIRGEHLREHVQEVADRDSSSDVPVSGGNVRNGLVLAATGTNVDYQGAAGNADFDVYGDPSTGFYAWWKVNDDGSITTTRSRVEPGRPPP